MPLWAAAERPSRMLERGWAAAQHLDNFQLEMSGLRRWQATDFSHFYCVFCGVLSQLLCAAGGRRVLPLQDFCHKGGKSCPDMQPSLPASYKGELQTWCGKEAHRSAHSQPSQQLPVFQVFIFPSEQKRARRTHCFTPRSRITSAAW